MWKMVLYYWAKIEWTSKNFQKPSNMTELGPFARTCNPSKWEADIWGWLEVRRSAMLHFNKRQRPHWACRQYSHDGGTQGLTRCQEMATLPAGCIPQRKVPSASSSGSLGVIVCVQYCRIVYQLGILSLSCSQYSQTIYWRGWDDNAYLGVTNNSIGAWPIFLVWSLPWYCIVLSVVNIDECSSAPYSVSSVTNKQTIHAQP